MPGWRVKTDCPFNRNYYCDESCQWFDFENETNGKKCLFISHINNIDKHLEAIKKKLTAKTTAAAK